MLTHSKIPLSDTLPRPTLLSIVLLLAPLFGCQSQDPQQASEERVLVVTVAEAESVSSHEIAQSHVGLVEAARRSSIGFDQAGVLTELTVDEGERVTSGQTLALLDTRRLEAQHTELSAARSEADTSVELATSTLERLERASDRNAVSEQDVDEARQRQRAALAVRSRIDAQIDLLEVEIDKSTLRSPFEAIVASRRLDEGQVVAPGSVVFELVERESPRARIGVRPELARQLSEQSTRDLLIGDRTVTGRFLQALPEQDPRTRTVDVLFALDASLDELHVGETATLELERSVSAEGLWLPQRALTESVRGMWSCYVAVPLEDPQLSAATHRLEKRQLELLEVDTNAETGSSRVFVRGTLQDGELYVAEGIHRLAPGQRVRLEASANVPMTGAGAR